ncbi:MAG: hypothetical protein OHK0022_20930 [Roseiflexaceae bacterium]
MLFPTVKGASLAGRSFTLPTDLEGRWNIVALTFDRQQQEDVDTWLPTLKLLQTRYPDLCYYTLQIAGRNGPLSRWYNNTMMRFEVLDRATRSHTIAIHQDRRVFSELLDADEQQIVLLLLDQSGYVYWRADGLYTYEQAEDLAAVLDSYQVTQVNDGWTAPAAYWE